MIRSPAISVVIPTYNRATLVVRAVRSALAALRSGDEVIVVDDGSNDDTVAQLAEHGERVRCLRSPHRGPGAARNLGISVARSPLVAFLDSDDEWMPDKVELQRALMRGRPDVLFCFTDFAVRTRTGAEIRRYLGRWHGDPRSWDEILGPGFAFSTLGALPPGRPDFGVHVGDLYRAAMAGDYVCTCTVVVRREGAGPALRFAEDLEKYEDWECFARLARAGTAAYLDCETFWNYGHEGPRLTQADELYAATARLTVLERVWGSDPDFLAGHGALYGEALASRRRARAKALLALGRTREAKEQLRLAGSSSLVDKTLASLPGSLTRVLVRARRRAR